MNEDAYTGPERRKHLRFYKNFSLLFYYKNSTYRKSDGTFIRDISKGGIRFTTANEVKVGTVVVFEIGVPNIAPKKLVLEGTVVTNRQISDQLGYEAGAKFNGVDKASAKLLDQIEEQYIKEVKGIK